jgi:hypothetical protein
VQVIRPRLEEFLAMIRVRRTVVRPGGFSGRSAPAVSSRLIQAVAVSLAIGSLSLGLIVALVAVSIRVAMAMPIPA